LIEIAGHRAGGVEHQHGIFDARAAILIFGGARRDATGE
jgi:hypothetical protein